MNVLNCDETSLFYKLMPDRPFVINKNDCKGGKKAKDMCTMLLCTNWFGTNKLSRLLWTSDHLFMLFYLMHIGLRGIIILTYG